ARRLRPACPAHPLAGTSSHPGQEAQSETTPHRIQTLALLGSMQVSVSPRSSSDHRRAIRDTPPRLNAVNSTLPGMEKPVIKVAVPNKGALSEPAAEMLREAGYAQRSDDELALLDDVNNVEFFYLRPRDIAVYVGEGTLDVGITGRDMLLDSGAHASEVMPLGFGRSRFRFAAPKGSAMSADQLHDLPLATA